MTDEVLVEHSDGLMIVTINRPDQRNAVNRAVSYGVCEAVDEFDRNPALRVGILTGAGGTFCSGMDLKSMCAATWWWRRATRNSASRRSSADWRRLPAG